MALGAAGHELRAALRVPGAYRVELVGPTAAELSSGCAGHLRNAYRDRRARRHFHGARDHSPCKGHTHAHPHENQRWTWRLATGHGYANTNQRPDGYRNADAHRDTWSNPDTHSHANTYGHAWI